MTGRSRAHPATPSAAVVFGTRPEAIKLAPVVLALRTSGFDVRAVTTGQHEALVREVLPLFGIEAAADLAIMKAGQSLDYVLGAVVQGLGTFLETWQPDVVVVQGDTTSTLAAALAAYHHRLPVAHVEAGLRTHDRWLPFPEEMNRRLTSDIARWHFAPTQHSADNLALEGITDGVEVTGNTVVDAVRHILDGPAAAMPDALAGFIAGRPYVLATAHRRESWGAGIGDIARALRTVSERRPDVPILFAAHPNPAARGPVDAMVGDVPGIRILDALPYPVFLRLLAGARLAVSDSGGVQEEGPTLGIPVVVTRTTTERPEGVDAGAVRLAGTDHDRIVADTLEILGSPEVHAAMAAAGHGLYGDGLASGRIAATLLAGLAAE